MRNRTMDFWICTTLALAALFASVGFYSFPLTDMPIGTDSAVFTYIGEAVAGGGVPYADVFDHKGPLVYAINAVGSIGPSSWALWLIEWLFLSASLCLGYGIGRVVGAPRLSAAVVPILLVSYIVFHAEGGNMTEEYCLAFMSAVMLLAVRTVQGAPLRAWQATVMGACAGCAFMLRFTELAGLLPFCIAVLAVVWAKRGAWRALSRAGLFLLGFAAVCAAFAAWLASAGALDEFWGQYFAFNLAYASAGAATRGDSLRYFAGDPALLLAVIASAMALVLCWAYRHGKCGREMTVALVNFAGLALLFCLAAFSGRSYGHYLLMFVPMYFVAYNAAVLQVCRAARNRAVLAVLGAIVGLGAVYLPAGYGSVHEVAYRSTLVEPRAAVVAELAQVAGRGNVLVVGNECWVYLDGGFQAPSPYAYRSDAMSEAYEEWLASLIAGENAPDAIAVAEYVDLGMALDPYREVSSVGGFTLYAR